MFCDRCGTQLHDGQSFCPSCGKPVGTGPLAPRECQIAGHVRLLGILWLAYSGLRLTGGWFMRWALPRFLDFGVPHLPLFVPALLRGIGLLLIATGVLGIVAGWGLLDRQPWARMLAIVLGCLALLHFGLGTLLGIYTLWVLLPADHEREYRSMADAA